MLTNYDHSEPVYGFGINDSGYTVYPKVNGKLVRCPFYDRWVNMLGRAFASKESAQKLAYINTTISDSFKYFMDFRRWAEGQGFGSHNKHLVDLDKDILVSGNNEYSTEKCAFVIQRINKIIVTGQGGCGIYPLGVRLENRTGKFVAVICVHGKPKHLGTYTTPEQAHKAWQLSKAQHIENSVANYEQESESIGLVYRQDVVEAILKRSTLLRDAAESGKIINSL